MLTLYLKMNAYAQDLHNLAVFDGIRIAFPKLVQFASRIPLPPFTTVYASLQRLGSYAETSIARYEKMVMDAPSVAKPSLFTKLFNADEENLSRAEIEANAQTYILAGSDTTAHSLTYLTWAVCRDEAVKAKLVDELRSLPDEFSDADLKRLKYLNYVMLETLRCYAAAPGMLPRDVPSGGREIDGYFVPEGTVVQTQGYCMHRNSDVFPDPYRCVYCSKKVE